ncbi:MAG: carbamoyltransferase HypF [Acidimicrobiales bacterium]
MTGQRRSITVFGTVQGVGFRPFVFQLAAARGLSGWVRNDGRKVEIEAEGSSEALDGFLQALETDAPPLAEIRSVEVAAIPTGLTVPLSASDGNAGFRILASETAGPGLAAIPPDVAPCAHCLAELADPENRRFAYPFTCCTDCGPRYTVVGALPYDREGTAMAPFALCEACLVEYRDPGDRRFHAQATCCPTCGPQLDRDIEQVVEQLRGGAVVAVKGPGGYQLVCRADRSDSVAELRRRKRREQKPFAVLVGSIDSARLLVQLDRLGERALTGPEAPIVLAPLRPGVETVTEEVAPGTGLLGVMLPSTPLHRLLADGVGVPLVCTSGNLSEEPIIIDDAAARRRLGEVADTFLGHDRTIERRADDSVGQVVHGRFQLLRRARGFAPRPIALGEDGPTVLGVGAELKSTVCLAAGAEAAVSVHLGDMENPATLEAFESTIADQLSLTGVEPELIVHDLHPEYLSTKFAVSQDLAPTLAVQHHHAHMAACLVDNGYTGPAIGVTFDGLGWGTDDTAWGGEILVGDAGGYTRAAHLKTVALPGGVAALREPWRMALAHLITAGFDSIDELPSLPCFARDELELNTVFGLCGGDRSPVTSSMGRLFDAVAALCGVGVESGSTSRAMSYEGQAAIGLEQLASQGGKPSDPGYRWQIEDGSSTGDATDNTSSEDVTPAVIDAGSVVLAVVDDLTGGRAASEVAARFHRSVANLVVDLCERQRARDGLNVAALTGGVFQNRVLVELTVPLLESHGFTVLRHAQVPPNDGGISLGQVAIGRAHLARL